MKKNFLALFLAFGVTSAVCAQEQAAEAPTESQENISESFNHWSIAVKGGVDYLRYSDQNVDYEVGGLIERTFNPRWGMGVEYMYLNKKQDALRGFPDMKVYSNDVSLFGSMNISNIIAPYRSSGWQKLNLYALGGAGASIYGYKPDESDADFETGGKFLVWAGANLEYAICDYVGIFLEGQYRFHSNEEWNGFTGGRSMVSANLGFRLKFAGESNIRNIAWVDYIPQVELPDFNSLFEAQKEECSNMTARMEDQINAQNEQIKKLQNQVKFVQDSLDRHIFQTKVPEKYTPTAEEKAIIQTALANLEFESGKDVIKESSYTYLDGLAVLLKSHKEWSVQLKGYTDNSGNKAKNLQLSKDRAAAVRAYLVKKGVDPVNIESEGYGSANPIASNNTAAGKAKNRRVEIELFSK